MVKTNKKFQVSETIQGNRPSQKWIAVTGLSVDANLSLSQRKSEREVWKCSKSQPSLESWHRPSGTDDINSVCARKWRTTQYRSGTLSLGSVYGTLRDLKKASYYIRHDVFCHLQSIHFFPRRYIHLISKRKSTEMFTRKSLLPTPSSFPLPHQNHHQQQTENHVISFLCVTLVYFLCIYSKYQYVSFFLSPFRQMVACYIHCFIF